MGASSTKAAQAVSQCYRAPPLGPALNFTFKNVLAEGREMVQWLRAVATLPESLVWFLACALLVWLTTTCKSS